MKELITVTLGSAVFSIPSMLVFVWLTGIDSGLVGVVFGLGGIAIAGVVTQRNSGGW